MAKKVDSKFLVIEAKGSEFLAAGFGGGPVEDCGVITSGVFEGFSLINVGTGGYLVCDCCNSEINAGDTCYYVSVLNKIMCEDCFVRWHSSAKYYPEDVPFERKNYDYTKHKLEVSHFGFDEV